MKPWRVIVWPRSPTPRMQPAPTHPPFSIFFPLQHTHTFCHHSSWPRSSVFLHGNRQLSPPGGAHTDAATRRGLDPAPTCCGHVLRKVDMTVFLLHQARPPPPSPHRVRAHRTLAITFSLAGSQNRRPYARSSNPASTPHTRCHDDTGTGKVCTEQQQDNEKCHTVLKHTEGKTRN